MDRNEAEWRLNEINRLIQNGTYSDKEAESKLKRLNKEIKKSNKMDKSEKKELAHRIIKIILEVILQIITLGLPSLINKKTMLKH